MAQLTMDEKQLVNTYEAKFLTMLEENGLSLHIKYNFGKYKSMIPIKDELASLFSLVTDSHLNDRYELERIVHGGTNSIFTQAKDWQNSCAKLAVKILTDIHGSNYRSARKIERFERQIERQQKLDHKNIVRILDHGKSTGGYSFIVFEFVDGFSLAETKNAIKYLPIKYLLRALCQTCDALSYAAENGAVHNDLSPNDILLYGDPNNNLAIKITDFSKGSPLLHNDNRSLQLTEHGDCFGSPEYMSPVRLAFNKSSINAPMCTHSDAYYWKQSAPKVSLLQSIGELRFWQNWNQGNTN